MHQREQTLPSTCPCVMKSTGITACARMLHNALGITSWLKLLPWHIPHMLVTLTFQTLHILVAITNQMPGTLIATNQICYFLAFIDTFYTFKKKWAFFFFFCSVVRFGTYISSVMMQHVSNNRVTTALFYEKNLKKKQKREMALLRMHVLQHCLKVIHSSRSSYILI